MAEGDLYFDCSNNEALDVSSILAQLVIEDENGNPCLKVCGGEGGGSVTLNGISFRELCDRVEVDIDGNPLVGGGYYRNYHIVRKFTQDENGVETLVDYFNYDGTAYTVLGVIQSCPEVLCCEDWIGGTANKRMVFTNTDYINYLSEPTETFQQGTNNLKYLISNYQIDGVAQSGQGQEMIMTPANIQFLEISANSINSTPVGVGTTENNFQNLVAFLNSITNDALTQFHTYWDDNAQVNGIAIDVSDSRDFTISIDKLISGVDTLIHRYIFSFNSNTGTANWTMIQPDGVTVGGSADATLNNPSNGYASLLDL